MIPYFPLGKSRIMSARQSKIRLPEFRQTRETDDHRVTIFVKSQLRDYHRLSCIHHGLCTSFPCIIIFVLNSMLIE